MPPLTEEMRRTLLLLARRALEKRICGRISPEQVLNLPPALLESRGAFVTLRKHGQLRGCTGHVQTSAPLFKTVQECAVAAALADPRFDPVSPEEVPRLLLEVSVLSPPATIAPEQILIGKHGLIISHGRRRGLLLPQVPVAWNWNRGRFLEETCVKAGLSRDAWRKGARIEAFSAEVFEESPESPALLPSQGSAHPVTTR